MGAPAAAVMAVARSKTARRALLTVASVFIVAVVSVAAPLLVALFLTGAAGADTGKARAALPAGPVSKGGWTYPLVGPYWKGRGFGPDPNIAHVCAYCSTFHEGYDMSQGCGATIHAAGPGRVTTAGQYFGYGNAVVIDNGGGIVTIYGHMAWGSLRVGVGQTVRAGAPIGAEGDTGHSLGCHLHFEVRVHGTPVDPQPFMAARGLPLK